MPTIETMIGATLVVAALASGCSLVIESSDRQCEQDADCAAFDDAVCDVALGVCVPDENAACEGPNGCYACEPERPEELLNACTEAACLPYDNTQLEGLLLEGGGLPPAP